MGLFNKKKKILQSPDLKLDSSDFNKLGDEKENEQLEDSLHEADDESKEEANLNEESSDIQDSNVNGNPEEPKISQEEAIAKIKAASDMVYKIMEVNFKEPGGKINVNEFLVFSGGMAGYICSNAIWEKYVRGQMIAANRMFTMVTTDSGKNFYFGKQLNHYLLEAKYSVWSLTAGMYINMYPNSKLPDIVAIVSRASAVVGDDSYKICGKIDPEFLLKQFDAAWDSLRPMVIEMVPNADEWPIVFGMVVQKVMKLSKFFVKPEDSINMIMESALYISKMDMSDRYE